MTRAEFRQEKALFLRNAAALRRAEMEQIVSTRKTVNLSQEGFDGMLQEKTEEARRETLALQGAVPLGRAFGKAAFLLGDAYKGSICYATIPDLAGTRVIAQGVCPSDEVGGGIFKESQVMGHETSTWRDARYEVSKRRFGLDQRGILVVDESGAEGVLIKGVPFAGETVGTTAILMARRDFDDLYSGGMAPPQRVWPMLWKGLCFFGQREDHQPAHAMPLDQLLSMPSPGRDDPDQFEALVATVRYMTALYGEQYATRALCGK